MSKKTEATKSPNNIVHIGVIGAVCIGCFVTGGLVEKDAIKQGEAIEQAAHLTAEAGEFYVTKRELDEKLYFLSGMPQNRNMTDSFKPFQTSMPKNPN